MGVLPERPTIYGYRIPPIPAYLLSAKQDESVGEVDCFSITVRRVGESMYVGPYLTMSAHSLSYFSLPIPDAF
jgi:hypothetical protein